MYMACNVQNCENETFENLGKCALHCSEYYITSKSYYKYNIKRLFKNYVYRCLSLAVEEYRNGYLTGNDAIFISELNSGSLDRSYFSDLNHIEINIMYVYIHKDIYYEEIIDNDLKYIFERVKYIKYEKCHFIMFFYDYIRKSFYYDCVFEEKIIFTEENDFAKASSDNEYIFQECKFNGGLSIQNMSVDKKVIERKIFYECSFKEIYLLGVVFRDEFLYLCDENPYDNEFSDDPVIYIDSIIISNCVFDKSLNINSMNIGINFEIIRKHGYLLQVEKMEISDCEFKEHLEIKRASVKSFLIKKTIVHKTFDASSSDFGLFYCNKVSFLDFAIFENSHFGKTGLYRFLYKTDFFDTTFFGFSNFRNTKFKSGLNFSSANLKQEPNFLNTEINLEGTDRETFRIVKNSFEKNNNKIEAGKYHAQEMSAYIDELSFKKNFWQLVVLYLNKLISRFGQSYTIPFALLVGSVSLYSYLLNSYKKSLQFRTYELPYGVECIAEWLNTIARNFLPFARFISDKRGFEFVSLFFYIVFAILVWQIIVAVKKQTQH